MDISLEKYASNKGPESGDHIILTEGDIEFKFLVFKGLDSKLYCMNAFTKVMHKWGPEDMIKYGGKLIKTEKKEKHQNTLGDVYEAKDFVYIDVQELGLKHEDKPVYGIAIGKNDKLPVVWHNNYTSQLQNYLGNITFNQ